MFLKIAKVLTNSFQTLLNLPSNVSGVLEVFLYFVVFLLLCFQFAIRYVIKQITLQFQRIL